MGVMICASILSMSLTVCQGKVGSVESFGLVIGHATRTTYLGHCIIPRLDLPRSIARLFSLCQAVESPNMLNGVQLANLTKVGCDWLDKALASLETAPPVALPLEQRARSQVVCAQLIQGPLDAAFLRRRSSPECKFLRDPVGARGQGLTQVALQLL